VVVVAVGDGGVSAFENVLYGWLMGCGVRDIYTGGWNENGNRSPDVKSNLFRIWLFCWMLFGTLIRSMI
jgi:hypothetical protein